MRAPWDCSQTTSGGRWRGWLARSIFSRTGGRKPTINSHVSRLQVLEQREMGDQLIHGGSDLSPALIPSNSAAQIEERHRAAGFLDRA